METDRKWRLGTDDTSVLAEIEIDRQTEVTIFSKLTTKLIWNLKHPTSSVPILQ